MATRAVGDQPGVVKWAMSIPPFTPCPATGDAFIGRQGLVRNLRGRIAKGESLAVIGGPKLGKTSLVRTALDGLSDRTVIEVDLGMDPSPRLAVVPGSIVVLDNLDDVAGPAIEPLLARLSAAGAARPRRNRWPPTADAAGPLRDIGRGEISAVSAVSPAQWGDATADRQRPESFSGHLDGKSSLPDKAATPLSGP